MDLDELLQSLPEDLREMCDRLKNDSISQVARELGIPRSTLRDRVCKIRRRFEQSELQKYL